MRFKQFKTGYKYIIVNRFFYAFNIILLVVISTKPLYSQWKNLVKNGLKDWAELNGTANFRMEKDVITGSTVPNSPNSFLCTKEKFSDFILEFDTWFDSGINSGVQFRSESTTDYQNGRVHGYQVEIDPSGRSWSGGIYDEGRRGWLYTLDNNPAGKKALKAGEWNHYRVEAIGNSIRTWVNGVPCADLIDALTPSGFIGLQVHSIGSDSSKAGEKVKFRNIRIITNNPEKYKTPYSPVIPQISFLDNRLTDREVRDGWTLLFDGKTPEGWMNAKTKRFPENGWEIKDGVLSVTPATKGPDGGGDIVTVKPYRDFHLIVDFMYSPGANSGIKYFVDTESDNGSLASIGCEYQILDDKLHPDAKLGKNGDRILAGLYDLIPPKNKRDNGPGIWNRAEIIVIVNKVQHWLNGFLTVEYERGNDAWRELVATSKFKDFKGFGEASKGRILLQDHGNFVSF